jgi:hypothetical protein
MRMHKAAYRPNQQMRLARGGFDEKDIARFVRLFVHTVRETIRIEKRGYGRIKSPPQTVSAWNYNAGDDSLNCGTDQPDTIERFIQMTTVETKGHAHEGCSACCYRCAAHNAPG